MQRFTAAGTSWPVRPRHWGWPSCRPSGVDREEREEADATLGCWQGRGWGRGGAKENMESE